MHLAICAIFRNEAPYLREWIAFHRIVGFERFYLYQNRSDDDYAEVLRDDVENGSVVVTDWPHPPPCQLEAYQHFIAQHAGAPWWVAFIDCDEFLFSPGYATVGEALAALADPDWGAVGVNWMCFGASGEEQKGPGLVTERFTLRPGDGFSRNRHIKSIVNMRQVRSVAQDPHHFDVHGGTFGESGEEIIGPLSSIPRHALLRIHHYHTKSRQEYLRRIALGKADGAAAREPGEFDEYQPREVEDRSIWRFLPELRARMAQYDRRADASDPAPDTLRALPHRIELPLPPRTFAGYRDCHAGETLLVCGCGASLADVVAPERFVTIGVNDVGRLFDPDYLVVINPPEQFAGDRFQFIATSRAHAVFTHLELGLTHPNVVRFQLGQRGGSELSDSDCLPFTANSPYVALCLALHLGARRIGLIGVDFTDHHFFGKTGHHPLAAGIRQIDQEYAALAQTCRRMGVEVFNLSAQSRLTAFPYRSPADFARQTGVPAQALGECRGYRIFFVNYRFLSCGEVFADGLQHASEDLGMQAEAAWWDDPQLDAKIAAFAPDLVFVVHGRKYSQQLRAGAQRWASAVWLLDEPYEVDDTAGFSGNFDHVFVNDPSTLGRHRNAHYLPVCHDPVAHCYLPGPRPYLVGFIGGANPRREAMLVELANAGLLSYAVGGPWRSAALRRLSPSPNISAAECAARYRQTRIVLNVFRTEHHYNREGIAARSMNPRIYEALACGALVVSERRPEIAALCPELPVFDGPEELISVIRSLLANPAAFECVRRACMRRLAGHTYAERLYRAFRIVSGRPLANEIAATRVVPVLSEPLTRRSVVDDLPLAECLPPGWEADPLVAQVQGDALLLCARRPAAPGSEAGLIGLTLQTDVRLSFEFKTAADGMLVAKIHQLRPHDQLSNSYHVMIDGRRCYLARHGHVFHSFALGTGAWHAIALTWQRGVLHLQVDGKCECLVRDTLLPAGYSFVGVKRGRVQLRGLVQGAPDAEITPVAVPPQGRVECHVLCDSGADRAPRVSIVTTVYDRVACLEACIRSVQALQFDDYEHIIVADAPPKAVLAQIRSLVAAADDGRHRLRLAVLRTRVNDWGMTPAATGLSLSTGPYVCFLSDDNGYRPTHFGKLTQALDQDPGLGFVYSDCLYDGRLILNTEPPALGSIDLGQPLFRRELFDRHLPAPWPFRCLAWDWKVIEAFLRAQVRWRRIGDATFLFRLAKYPEYAPPARNATLTA